MIKNKAIEEMGQENEIIQIKQLPIIEEKLKSLETEIKKKIEIALSLVVNEDTCKEIKKTRAELNKEFKELEALRKNIKARVLKPYEDFEKIYKEVTGYYGIADRELANRVTEVESSIKDEKEKEIKQYFEEYKKSLLLEYDFITYEKAKLNITLSVSLKKLKEEVKAFLDKINEDIKAIKQTEHSNDLFFEYSKTLDIGRSIIIVRERLKAIEEQKRQKERTEEKEKAQQEVIKKVEETVRNIQVALPSPTIEIEEEKEEIKLFKINFTVTGTFEELKKLKEFLNNGGYTYE